MRWLLIVWTLVFTGGCTGELIQTGGGGGGPDAGVANNIQGRADFDNNVRPLLVAIRPKMACVMCHEAIGDMEGPDFLGTDASTNYTSLTASITLVGATPAASLFLTKGDHVGNEWCTGLGTPYPGCQVDETIVISAWLMVQASGL